MGDIAESGLNTIAGASFVADPAPEAHPPEADRRLAKVHVAVGEIGDPGIAAVGVGHGESPVLLDLLVVRRCGELGDLLAPGAALLIEDAPPVAAGAG